MTINKKFENSIDGFKYLVTLDIIVDMDDYHSYPDNICVCDTRDNAINIIKEHYTKNIEVNKKYNITAEPKEINRSCGVVKWKDKNNKEWMWVYSISPIKYEIG